MNHGSSSLPNPLCIRYNAVRRIFDDSANIQKIALQVEHVQVKLVPLVAHAIVLKVFYDQLTEQFYSFVGQTMFGEISEALQQCGHEIHVLSCAGKAVATWQCMEGLRECMELCGEHAYLSVSVKIYSYDDNKFGSV